MVRQCAVENCLNTDATTIAHRFPRKKQHADAWRKSLNLQRFALTELVSKFVICTQHFIASDYRHRESNFLNFTAIPKLTSNDLLRDVSQTSATSKQISRKTLPTISSTAAIQHQQKLRRAKLKKAGALKSKGIGIKSTSTSKVLTKKRSFLPKTIVAIPAVESRPTKDFDEEENVDYIVEQEIDDNEDVFTSSDEISVLRPSEIAEDPVKIVETPFTLGILHEDSSSTQEELVDEMSVDEDEDNVEDIDDDLPYYIEDVEEVDDSSQNENVQDCTDNTICQSPSWSSSQPQQKHTTADVSVSTDDIDATEITDINRPYVYVSKLELINKLIAANEKISVLELNLGKLETEQKQMKGKMELIQSVLQNR